MIATEPAFHQLILVGGRLCLDFCNTVEYRHSERPFELLQNGYSSLLKWSTHLQLISTEEADLLRQGASTPEAEKVFVQAIELREASYKLFYAIANHEPLPSDALKVVNEAAQVAFDQREIVSDNGQVRWVWRNRESLDVMLWSIALSAVELLFDEEPHRIQQCPGCNWLFYDGSRNRSRTWCDMRYCGNRSKAKRFYQRQKSS